MPISDAFASLGRNRPAAIAMLALLCAVLGAAMLKVNGLFIVAGLAGLAAAYFLISFPFACVPIYYMLLYLRPGDVYPFLDKLRLILLIVALMGGAFLLRVLVFRTLRVLRNAQLIFIITLLGLIGLSIVDSFYRSASLAKFQEMARILLMVVLVVHIVDDFKKLKIMAWSILLSLSYLASMNFSLWATGQKVVDNGGSGGMSGGFLGDGNDFALALNTMLPIAIFQFMSTRSWKIKFLSLFVIVSFVASVVATYSRGGFLGTIAVFGMTYFFYMLRTRQWVKGITIAVVVSVIGGLTIVALAPKTFTDRMGGIQDYEEDESALGRLDAWGAGLRMLKDRPLLGVGAGAFSDAYGRKYKPFDAVAANWREAHSLYVQTFSELGVTGFGLLLGLFFLMFRDQRRVHQYALKDPQTQKEIHFFGDALTTGLVGLLVSGAFLSVLYYPHIYILSAMTMILLRVAQDFSRADHALEEETARAR